MSRLPFLFAHRVWIGIHPGSGRAGRSPAAENPQRNPHVVHRFTDVSAQVIHRVVHRQPRRARARRCPPKRAKWRVRCESTDVTGLTDGTHVVAPATGAAVSATDALAPVTLMGSDGALPFPPVSAIAGKPKSLATIPRRSRLSRHSPARAPRARRSPRSPSRKPAGAADPTGPLSA